VFLDEIDKITARSERMGADVSREGVQRDLLPLIEGTVVATKHGTVKTDHILFIASGAFHFAKPSDLLLEEPENSLIRQYMALLATEEVTLDFTDEAIGALADLAAEINTSVENIGARRLHTVLEKLPRRLHTVLEKLLEEISFTATDRGGETVVIDKAMVHERVAELAKDSDLSKFIL
jgi:ATP-dependent HslUV protease ATP-binding subunit HslU